MSTYANAFTLKASKFTLTKRNGMKSTNTKNNKSLNNQSEFGKFKYTRPISKNKPKKELICLASKFDNQFFLYYFIIFINTFVFNTKTTSITMYNNKT